MKKGKLFESRKHIKTVCIGLGILMVALVLYSIFFFRYKIRESAELIDSLEYNTYDGYYVMITNDRKSSFWQSVYRGANETARNTGAYVELFGENLNEDYDKQDLMKIAIASKVDGIIVEADESIYMEERIREAHEAGIPVVTALFDNPESYRQSYVGVSSYNLGREYGAQVCKIAKEKGAGNYSVLVLLDEGQTGSTQNIVIGAIREAIQFENMGEMIQVETTQVDSGSVFAAEESIRDIFMESANLPDIIVCLDERNTTCVYQTVVDYNKVGQVEIVGYYESENILSAIGKDVIYSTISIDTEQMGSYCVEALNEYRQMKHVSDYFGVDITVIDSDVLGQSAKGGTDEKIE